LVAFAAAASEFGDEVAKFVAGVVAQLAFEPPEHADGHRGDEGDHEESG
jgi:hypothetical protein